MEDNQNSTPFSGSAMDSRIEAMRCAINNIIIGQAWSVDLLLTAILANGHVLIEGVPGVAKTLSARLIAKLIDAKFSRVQFTSDIMPSDVLGTNVFNMGTNKFDFHAGPIFGDIILVDEINRAPAKTQSALFEVMEEKQATIDGVRYPMSNIYTVFATQNPIEQEGTYRLPEAQMDRFMFKVVVGYPNADSELEVLRLHNSSTAFSKLDDVSPVLSHNDILDLRQKAQNVHVDDKLMTYIVQIVAQTRQHQNVYVAASPRASIALLNSVKAYALINGRDFAIPDDIKMLAIPVLQHRISLTAEAEMNGVTIEQVVKGIINKVEVPK